MFTLQAALMPVGGAQDNGQPGWSELAAAWKTPVQEERNNNPEQLRIRGFEKCLQS